MAAGRLHPPLPPGWTKGMPFWEPLARANEILVPQTLLRGEQTTGQHCIIAQPRQLGRWPRALRKLSRSALVHFMESPWNKTAGSGAHCSALLTECPSMGAVSTGCHRQGFPTAGSLLKSLTQGKLRHSFGGGSHLTHYSQRFVPAWSQELSRD